MNFGDYVVYQDLRLGKRITLIWLGGFQPNNYLCVVTHDHFLSSWLPFGRFRIWLHLAPLKVGLEICFDFVFSGRNVAEGISSVFFQSVVNVVREWAMFFAVYRNTTTVLVREMCLVRGEDADTNCVHRLVKGRERYIGQANSCFN